MIFLAAITNAVLETVKIRNRLNEKILHNKLTSKCVLLDMDYFHEFLKNP